MKKFWMISMLIVAAIFAVSCGGGDSDGDSSETKLEGSKCENSDAFNCDQNDTVVLICDSDTNKWAVYKKCQSNQKCDAQKKGCVDKDNGGNSGDNGGNSGDNGDNGGNNGGNGGSTQTDMNCLEIYNCMVDCNQDRTCMQTCMNNGSKDGQTKINAMLNCFNTNCADAATDADFQTCAQENCSNEMMDCQKAEGNDTYKAPYGKVTLNFSVDQIASLEDQEEQQQQQKDYQQTGQQPENPNNVGYVMSAFAEGTYGNGSASVVPSGATMQVQAVYYDETDAGTRYTGVQVIQIPVIGNAGGNPVILLNIPEENAGVGSLKLHLWSDIGQATIEVVDINWNTGKPNCVHAFGIGTLNVTAIGDIADNGELVFTGDADLYSAKNFDEYGDVSGNLGATFKACDPVN